MRSTVQLISELERVAESAKQAALVIQFKRPTNVTALVWVHDEDRLEILNDLRSGGGYPIGIICWFRENKSMQFRAWPLDEVADDDHVLKSIEEIMTRFNGELGKYKCVFS